MIISKTPVRVSFFGGGTDYPDYYRTHGGCVLSTTIDKYIYITVKPLEGLLEYKYRIAYSKLEICNEVDEIQHPVVKACIKYLNIKEGLEITIISDLPARTGIGSSSAFTVGLLNALYSLRGKMLSKEQLAREAIYVEQKLLQERVGVQDQIAAAYGNMNLITFEQDDKFSISPINISVERKMELQNNLKMFFTGVSRYSHQVIEEQFEKTKNNIVKTELDTMKTMTQDGLNLLCGKDNLNEFGKLLHQAWLIKKSISSSISNKHLDDIYERAINAGALGGKLLGAGGGGFFMFYVEKPKQEKLKQSLNELIQIPFQFEVDGTRIMFGG